MRITSIFQHFLSFNKDLSAWDIHVRKQIFRKVINGLIVIIYIVGGILIYLLESGKWDYAGRSAQHVSSRVIQVSQKEVAQQPVPTGPQQEEKSVLTDTESIQQATSKVNDTHQPKSATKAMVLVPTKTEQPTLQAASIKTKDVCSILVTVPHKRNKLPTSTSYWYAYPAEFEYADKMRKNYSGCVSEYLEQPYASVAMAISAVISYQQGGAKDFNFMGELVWSGKKFNNANEYFREFSLAYNPANIEDVYFDQYQGRDVSLVEQFWRAYLTKFFPDVHPKTIKEIMKRWGYEYTEL